MFLKKVNLNLIRVLVLFNYKNYRGIEERVKFKDVVVNILNVENFLG